MHPVNVVLAVVVFCGWFGLWWLALRAVAGRAFGSVEIVPAVMLAFVFPLIVVDIVAVGVARGADGLIISAWGGVAVVLVVARWISDRRASRK